MRAYNPLRKRLERALLTDGHTKAHDIAFHMLDWRVELDALHKLYDAGGKMSDEEALETLTSFLVHAPHHINAARFLCGLGAPEDVFDLGFVADRSPARPLKGARRRGLPYRG